MQRLIENSNNIYYLQTDLDGVILDCNNYFRDSYAHITPFRIQDIVHQESMKFAIVASERARRMRNDTVIPFVIRTINSENKYTYGLYEVIYSNRSFLISGVEAFSLPEEGSGIIRRQRKLLRDINFALNHGVKKHAANIEGLSLIADIKDIKINKALMDSIEGLNGEIAKLAKKFNRVD